MTGESWSILETIGHALKRLMRIILLHMPSWGSIDFSLGFAFEYEPGGISVLQIFTAGDRTQARVGCMRESLTVFMLSRSASKSSGLPHSLTATSCAKNLSNKSGPSWDLRKPGLGALQFRFRPPTTREQTAGKYGKLWKHVLDNCEIAETSKNV